MHVSDRVSQLVCKQTAHKNRGNIQKVHPHGEHSSIVEGKREESGGRSVHTERCYCIMNREMLFF